MSVLTPANQLTLLRMLLIPAFALLVLYGHLGTGLLVFLLAGLTDLLDGVIARRSGQKTALGAWLDPVADKLLLLTAFVLLTLPLPHLLHRLPVWLTVLVLSRDIGIVATVAIFNLAVEQRTFRPSIYGKLATAIYVGTGVITLYYNYIARPSVVPSVFVWAALAITIVSGLHYLVRAARIIREH
ncbi:MAG: CDP-alcohol phosphatidyltransferase family protein [Luteitalea sp.]|nr:CDP-alcohol phosphatidyltransferase family protein [Luteitalea sp.]